ncbi:hypothetical protein [Pyrobaculum sp.]|uniref:hypothetical protein n=1 Tax=Pyrobaculum sp. TaxID=2004705 RepID=UPI0031689465
MVVLGHKVERGVLQLMLYSGGRYIIFRCRDDCPISNTIINSYIYYINFDNENKKLIVLLYGIYNNKLRGCQAVRSLFLTERQKKALKIYIKSGTKGVAEYFNISKVGAYKLIKRTLERLLYLIP